MNKIIGVSTAIGIMIIVVAIIIISNSLDFDEKDNEVLTGTPADNYAEDDREKFCGTSEAKSNNYVKEFMIPTECTQPQAITTDNFGNVWFAESNTGRLAKFYPSEESFTEYENPLWSAKGPSMIYGIDYAADNSFWFTDDRNDSIWKFNIDTEEYHRFLFPSNDKSIPQKLKIIGSQMIVNDFTGNKLAIFDLASSDQNLSPFILPSNRLDAVLASFTIDGEKNIWYSNWKANSTGVLIKIDNLSLENAMHNFNGSDIFIDIESFHLPRSISNNGISFDNNGNLWISDSSSSSFYKFNPEPGNQNFTKYVTSKPLLDSYGNYSGTIQNPLSRPNWIITNSLGNLVFNEPQANRIGIMNPDTDTLIEYSIPSKNPFWADCGKMPDCGISQILDFTVDGDKIWFTQWVENKIGYIDTGKPLPFEISLNSTKISLEPEEKITIEATISTNSTKPLEFMPTISISDLQSGIESQLNSTESSFVDIKNPMTFETEIFANNESKSGEYKLLIGFYAQDVSISKFVTINIK